MVTFWSFITYSKRVIFALKNAQKVILFGDPENRSFTCETLKLCDFTKIMTKTMCFLYL